MTFTHKKITYQGEPAVHLALAGIHLVILTNILRIAHLGPSLNRNLLFLDLGAAFRRGSWNLLGGHRIWWAGKGADENHGAYTTDVGPIKVEHREDGNFVFTAPPDGMQLVKGFIIRPLTDEMVEVINFVRNAGDMLAAGALWPITCTDPVSTNAFYACRLNSGNAPWDAFPIVHFPSWGGGHATSAEGDAQFSQVISGDQWLHLFRPCGLEAKRAWCSPFGGQAMIMPDSNLTMFKAAPPFDHNSSYPIAGCNAAMYGGPWARKQAPGPAMVEMEDVGPEVQLYPGETTNLSVLFSLINQVTSPPEQYDFRAFTQENFLKSMPR